MDSLDKADKQSETNMLSVVKRQRIEDFIFHKLTLGFSLLVLFALMGIIVSLLINAWPSLSKFGVQFVWRVEWDIVNEEFGAAIAIFEQEYTLACFWALMIVACQLERVLGRLVISKDS